MGAWLLSAWVLLGTGQAIESPLTSAAVQAAFQEGQKLGRESDQAYPFAPNAVYHTADTLRLDPANGDIDAVVIGTPYERIRYQGYVAAIGEDKIGAQEARTRANLPDGSVAVLIFAHGSKPEDQEFLSGIQGVTMRLGGATLTPVALRRSGTSLSQYPDTPGEIGERFTGTATYIFRLTPAQYRASGTIRFTDATGKAFNIPVQLSKYR
ncbi:hypothetical protein [Deinococcus ruber]|uniref:hypothetical protein n=1 Tax=Deinococcus ruber TaxID=1848197 RepID=UPI00166E5EBB|nr:hypothetical protein [Deinococcus ruber]